jgi:hypothetical protein
VALIGIFDILSSGISDAWQRPVPSSRASQAVSTPQGFVAFLGFEKLACVNGCVNKRPKANGTEPQTNGTDPQTVPRHARLKEIVVHGGK